jgi:rhodanese-related sulfurtransferase
MNALACFGFAAAVILAAPAFAADEPLAASPAIENPAIDMPGYLADAHEAARMRQERRVTEAQFLAMRAEPGTIVLDARSRDRYDLLHIDGAVSLPFTDLTTDALAARIPSRDTRILIYCNNNFSNAPDAFPRKMMRASLNLSTFIALYTYGYRNVYELGPLVDINATDLPLASFAADPNPYAPLARLERDPSSRARP